MAEVLCDGSVRHTASEQRHQSLHVINTLAQEQYDRHGCIRIRTLEIRHKLCEDLVLELKLQIQQRTPYVSACGSHTSMPRLKFFLISGIRSLMEASACGKRRCFFTHARTSSGLTRSPTLCWAIKLTKNTNENKIKFKENVSLKWRYGLWLTEDYFSATCLPPKQILILKK